MITGLFSLSNNSSNKESLIVIPIRGGLGNQLFQLCGLLYLNATLPQRFSLGDALLNTSYTNKSNIRTLDISELIEESELVTISKYNKLRIGLSNYLWFPGAEIEKKPSDLPHERVSDKTKFLLSYFQNFTIVENTWDEMRLRFDKSTKFKRIFQMEPRDEIALHLRFGDYLSSKKTRNFHGVTNYDYYSQAVNNIFNHFGQKNVIVYSDQITIAKELLAKSSISEIKFCEEKNSFNNFLSMSSSKFLVTSNSTFSWWAAWIGNKIHDSYVVQPFPWYAKPGLESNGIYVPNWNQIERSIIS